MDTKSMELASRFRHFERLHRALLDSIVLDMGLYSSQPFLLFMLQNANEPTQKEIADMLNVSPASTAVTIKRMEKAGLIKRVIDEKDSRCNRITITSKGNELANECKQKFGEIDGYMYNGFSEQEQQQLLDFYKRIELNIKKLANDKQIKLRAFHCKEVKK